VGDGEQRDVECPLSIVLKGGERWRVSTVLLLLVEVKWFDLL
jgi:hypothetical protein